MFHLPVTRIGRGLPRAIEVRTSQDHMKLFSRAIFHKQAYSIEIQVLNIRQAPSVGAGNS